VAFLLIVTGLALVLVLGQGPAPRAIAQEPGLSVLPAQESQVATRREVERAIFDVLDRNHDGCLSRTEVTALPELAQSYARLDMNRDGRLDRIEFHVAMAAAFWGIAHIAQTPVLGAVQHPGPTNRRSVLDGAPTVR
jgi:EF hand